MIEHTVNRTAVDALLRRFVEVTNPGTFPVGVVILAASEFLGRAIVETCETPVQGVQLAAVMEDHIKRTLIAGYSAKGYNMGESVQ